MNVGKIALNGFRNYDWESTCFGENTNVIFGENAQGKTNLLEAVYLLSSGRSFRTRMDRELIGFSFSEAEILADVFSHGREQTIRIRLCPGQAKKVTVNGVKKSLSELSETLNVVLFCPDDLNLIKDGASIRRKMLDQGISQIRPRYSALLTEYNRLYEHKTRILRDWREKPSLLETLDAFSEGLCRVSAQMIRYRASYVSRLNGAVKPIHEEFSGKGENLSLQYRTVSTVKDPFSSSKEIYYDLCEHQESHRKAELESGLCLTGAHKDDVEILINDRSAKTYASQGQTRTAALSLKLGEREIILQETGEYPVLLLDDVLSELDEKRQEYVLNRIGGGQTLITCCEDNNISARTGGKLFCVREGRIEACT